MRLILVKEGNLICPFCGGDLKHYDYVRRIVRVEYGEIKWIMMERLICTRCGAKHRKIPSYLLPYKQYRKDIIQGFVKGQLSIFDLEYEDYPNEITIKRWRKFSPTLF